MMPSRSASPRARKPTDAVEDTPRHTQVTGVDDGGHPALQQHEPHGLIDGLLAVV
jgi:hypothetical protein